MIQQMRLSNDKKCNRSSGSYNKCNDKEQWIRITEGCPNNCPYCYEPTEMLCHEIPEIKRNFVKIMDMNLLSHKEQESIINHLGNLKVNNKTIKYELICGIDYRFLTQEIANNLKKYRFVNIRLAWDWFYQDQIKIKKAIDYLINAGYKPKELMVFMVCNWKISFKECCDKLELLKI